MEEKSEQIWAVLGGCHRAERKIAEPGAMASTPFDAETWITRHLAECPGEFACADWSSYRPALRKTYLFLKQSEQTKIRECER